MTDRSSTSTPYEIETRYLFGMVCQLSSERVGDTPAGTRIDLKYNGGTVFTNPEKYKDEWLSKPSGALEKLIEALRMEGQSPGHEPVDPASDPTYTDIELARDRDSYSLRAAAKAGVLQWFGIRGTILTGSDWCLVRNDAAVEFDGRITIQATDGFLIGAFIRGCNDLRDVVPPLIEPADSDDAAFYNAWLSPTKPPEVWPIALSIQFDAAQASQPWAAQEYQNNRNYWKYRELTRGLFIAVGYAYLNSDFISQVELDIYEVIAPLVPKKDDKKTADALKPAPAQPAKPPSTAPAKRPRPRG